MGKNKKWSKEAMIEAVKVVREGKMGYKTASKTFQVPRATLKDYVKSPLPPENMIEKEIGRPPVLSKDIEKMLLEYCLEMENKFYGLTADDLCGMAYQLAMKNNKPHPFCNENKKAGRKWQRLFLKRNPSLSMREPENLSMARIQGFSEENVKLFFSVLKPQLEKIDFDQTRIFNVDETGISIVQHKSTKIVSAKGKKQVQKLASAERGATITAVTCMSAEGQYVPPMLIFPQKNWQAELLDGAPPGSIGACSESGWITGPLFSRWLEHFILTVTPTKEKPVVLVLDGHYSHTRNVHVIDRAREAGVSIVCLPPHSTNKLQPLDVSFMFPLKTYYAKAIENWLANHPNRVVRKLQVASLFSEAYLRAATLQTAVNGFKKTGIAPFNPEVFIHADFLHCQQECANEENDSAIGVDNLLEPRPSKASVVSPKDIRQVPVITPSTSTRGGSAFLVTGTPHKTKVLEAEEKKKKVESQTTNKPTKGAKRRLQVDEARGTAEPVRLTPKRKPGSSTRSKQCAVESSSETDIDEEVPYVSTDDEDSEGDVDCHICKKPFSSDKRGEKWVRCTKCFEWCHELCSTSPKLKSFLCDFCVD